MNGRRFEGTRFSWLEERLEQLDASNMRRTLLPKEIHGKYLMLPNERRLLNFGSNDYLGFAMESSLQSSSASADYADDEFSEYTSPCSTPIAVGATASALVCGHSPWHQELCNRLAEFEQTEAVMLFPSGYAACSGVIAAIAEAGDVILSDALNHASIIDGCRLSKAERFIYPHRDVSAVKALLSSHRGRFHRAFIVTDSLFSMDGTCAPLSALCDLAEQFDAVLIVDEAHATGVFGQRGSGLCEEFGIEHRIPIRIGTLSKALGAHGGFVAAPGVVVDYLLQKSRSLIFSTAAPATVIVSILSALEKVAREPERRLKVLRLAEILQQGLLDAGFKVPNDCTPIIPIVFGQAQLTLERSQDLSDAGFFVPAIRPPTVPAKSSRLRISLSAAHDEEDVTALLRALENCKR